MNTYKTILILHTRKGLKQSHVLVHMLRRILYCWRHGSTRRNKKNENVQPSTQKVQQSTFARGHCLWCSVRWYDTTRRMSLPCLRLDVLHQSRGRRYIIPGTCYRYLRRQVNTTTAAKPTLWGSVQPRYLATRGAQCVRESSRGTPKRCRHTLCYR